MHEDTDPPLKRIHHDGPTRHPPFGQRSVEPTAGKASSQTGPCGKRVASNNIPYSYILHCSFGKGRFPKGTRNRFQETLLTQRGDSLEVS